MLVSGKEGPRIPLPTWYRSRNCGGGQTHLLSCLKEYLGVPSVQRIQLKVQVDRVGLGMCCPGKAALERIC